MTEKEALEKLSFCDDTKVLSYLQNLLGHVTERTWLKVLGKAWSRGEGTSHHLDWFV